MEGEQVQQPTPKKGGVGLQPNIAGALAYFLAPLSGIALLVIEKENKFVRFHAMQSILFIIVTVAAFFANVILAFVPILGLLTGLFTPIILVAFFVAWIFLMYKAFQNEEYELPVVGDIARKQVEKM